MKFNLIALSTLLALAAAADSTTSTVAPATTLSAEAQCATKCNANDVCCIAQCYHVPCPSDDQANDTNSCVAACPQGTGSPADTQKYADCEQKCYSSHFFPATGAVAEATNSASSGSSGTTASGSSATQTGSSSNSNKGASSTSGSATGTSSGAVQSTGAAANIQLGASGAGLFGLVLAAFAL
ncbi:uncharacterized protein N7473_001218 [Penicillium subrubescens]|uniref:GPI anchored serine-threonine rich protein n=1 Tax=Penicillium subrubescens TaxID=1316194 RepID=A0A1Q5T803_9EURO|nr:uncharacterized protein N7473_001218 [Penicillium subrubescens]KAJ5911915.1 hypothetical protein N7473_001218 [Penicillium subrubescens]OKO96369.1 hypothetical protein PENSUB_10544 [Penicillium subrubescens]